MSFFELIDENKSTSYIFTTMIRGFYEGDSSVRLIEFDAFLAGESSKNVGVQVLIQKKRTPPPCTSSSADPAGLIKNELIATFIPRLLKND